MSNKITKTGVRGFTLIELLVVIAIIGLLSTIIAAPIQSARKKARDAKKIAEVKSTQLALEQYAESNSAQYPIDLQSLSPQFMPLLSGFASATTSNRRDAFAFTTYEALAAGGASTTFSYHLGVKLEVYGPALETDRDCIGATAGAGLIAPACAVYNGNTIFATMLNNGSQLTPGTSTWDSLSATVFPTTGAAGAIGYGGNDFEALINNLNTGVNQTFFAEQSSSTCVNTRDCLFDVTSQQ